MARRPKPTTPVRPDRPKTVNPNPSNFVKSGGKPWPFGRGDVKQAMERNGTARKR